MKVIRKENSIGTNSWFLVGEGDITFCPAVIVVGNIDFQSPNLRYLLHQGDVVKKDTIPSVILDKFSENFKPLLATSDQSYSDLGVMVKKEEDFNKASVSSTQDLMDLLKRCRIELEGKEIADDLDKYIQKTESNWGMKYSPEETINVLESFKTAAKTGKIIQWVSTNVKRPVCDFWDCEVRITGSNLEILSLKPQC